MKNYQPGDKVEVRNVPWKGIIGTYIRSGRMFGIGPRFHEVELGDFLSGGSPRRVKVTKIRPVPPKEAR